MHLTFLIKMSIQPTLYDQWFGKFSVYGPFWPKNAILNPSVTQIGKSCKEHYHKPDLSDQNEHQPTSYDQQLTKYGSFLFLAFLAFLGPFGHFRGVKGFASGQKMKVYTLKNEYMQFLEPKLPHYQ